MTNIYDLSFDELSLKVEESGLPKFRTKQIYNWLYKSLVESFDEMTNLDVKTKSFLNDNFYIPNLVLETKQQNTKSQKALFKLEDGNIIESVLMHYAYGNSVCVTTQVGCKIGCSFCASGLNGFIRNLTTGEIVMQLIYFSRQLKKDEDRVSHIVVMGIGEPLDNYDNVINFIDIINDERSLNIGARHITVSTSGLVPKIYDIASYDKQINLAISLHAPNEELRSEIMKINKVYSMQEVIKAVDFYIEKTNRRVSIEYILLGGINDRPKEALELSRLLKYKNVHVNLIRYNTVKEFSYKAPNEKDVEKFKQILEDNHINVTIRKSLGNDIDGACGQLRMKHA